MPSPVVGAIGSAVIGASSANKAAKAQQAAANTDIAFQRETRDIIRGDLDPYREQGTNALAAYLYEMGLGPAPTFGATPLGIETFTEGAIPGQQTWNNNGDKPGGSWVTSGGSEGTTRYRVGDQVFDTMEDAQAYAQANGTGGTTYQGYELSPDYQFRMAQGQDSINALAGANGGLFSGKTLEALSEFNQGIASQGRSDYLSRLGGLIDTGVSSAQMSGQASQNAAAGVSNALAGVGNAGAAGAIGVGNALQNGIGNMAGIFQYQNQVNAYNPYNQATGQGNWWQGTA